MTICKGHGFNSFEAGDQEHLAQRPDHLPAIDAQIRAGFCGAPATAFRRCAAVRPEGSIAPTERPRSGRRRCGRSLDRSYAAGARSTAELPGGAAPAQAQRSARRRSPPRRTQPPIRLSTAVSASEPADRDAGRSATGTSATSLHSQEPLVRAVVLAGDHHLRSAGQAAGDLDVPILHSPHPSPPGSSPAAHKRISPPSSASFSVPVSFQYDSAKRWPCPRTSRRAARPRPVAAAARGQQRA